MFANGLTYIPGDDVIHRCDARVKLIALLAFSIAALAVQSWWELALMAGLVIIACALGHIPAGLMNRMLVPVYVLAAFSVLFNVIALPDAAGLLRGLFFGIRMVVLVAASFVVCITTTSSELLNGFTSLIAPLRATRLPVDDIALTLSLSVRFIPVIEREFASIRTAQVARGAESATSFTQKLKMWGNAFTSLFVGLFRQADSLAQAMDARCYGMTSKRTHLSK